MRQHTIPRDNPPITEGMTDHASGTASHDLIGTVVTAYDVPDSDRNETLLLFDNGRVVVVSCDPGYDNEDQRTPDRWEVVLYDATETEAGRAMRALRPGQWL